jgi:hypothetical protein
MAAFTPTGVELNSGVITAQVIAKEAVVAGQAVTSEGYLVDVDNTERYNIIGVAINDASIDGLIIYAVSGELAVTNTLTANRQIIVAPSGQLQYDDDLLTGDGYVIVGYTKDTSTIVVRSYNTQVTKA